MQYSSSQGESESWLWPWTSHWQCWVGGVGDAAVDGDGAIAVGGGVDAAVDGIGATAVDGLIVLQPIMSVMGGVVMLDSVANIGHAAGTHVNKLSLPFPQ